MLASRKIRVNNAATMSRIDYYRQQLSLELKDRAMSIGIGIGFIAMAGTGIWAIKSGELFGIVPVLAGASLAAGQFQEAKDATSSINEFGAKVAAAEI